MRIYRLYVRTIHSILSEEMEISMNDKIYKVIDIEIGLPQSHWL